MTNTNSLRIAFSNIAKISDGRFSVYNRGDLARACGLAAGASAEAWTLAALKIVGQWATRPTQKIGDVIVADYYGSAVVGRINGYDGSGYVHLSPVFPGSLMHQGRENADGLCLTPYQRKTTIKIGHKALYVFKQPRPPEAKCPVLGPKARAEAEYRHKTRLERVFPGSVTGKHAELPPPVLPPREPARFEDELPPHKRQRER
jgi:hypothetical protein